MHGQQNIKKRNNWDNFVHISNTAIILNVVEERSFCPKYYYLIINVTNGQIGVV